MNTATESATYIVDTNLLIDASARTDVEAYSKQRRASVIPVSSGTSVRGEMFPEGPVLNFRDISGNVVTTLMDHAGTTVAVLAAEAAFKKHRTYAKVIQAATAPIYREPMVDSTMAEERPEEIEQSIDTLFEVARDEYFEDGMESKFSRQLLSLVRKYGNWAIQEIAYLVIYEKANGEVSSEALRWLGRMDHPATHNYRLWLLERSLRCSSPRVRDAAVLGLASMREPHAIPFLKEAIVQERCIELREDMKQVLQEL